MKKDLTTSREALTALPKTRETTVLALTRDESLIALVSKASGTRRTEARSDPLSARSFLFERNVRLVVVDDGVIAEGERGWFLELVRRRAPDAFVVYLASEHDAEVEKRARSHGVLFYTAKPIDTARLTQVLRQLAKNLSPGASSENRTSDVIS